MKPGCISCQSKIKLKNITQIESLFPFDGAVRIDNYGYSGTLIWIARNHPELYPLACDDCITNRLVLLGNPSKQKYGMDDIPHLIHFDKNFTCRKCGEEFQFSKEEQQYWYEVLNFYIYSQPVHCKPCNKEIKTAIKLNTELSESLKEGKPTSESELLRIAEIYELMGKTAKMKSYLKAARKVRKQNEAGQ